MGFVCERERLSLTALFSPVPLTLLLQGTGDPWKEAVLAQARFLWLGNGHRCACLHACGQAVAWSENVSAARATNQLFRLSALLPFESGGAFRACLSITDSSCLNTPRDFFLQPWVHYSGRGLLLTLPGNSLSATWEEEKMWTLGIWREGREKGMF